MTAQVHEKIRFQGKPMRLATCPHFPVDHPRIHLSSEQEVEEFAKDRKTEIIFSTACWREYIGSWSIRRGRLYLTKLEGRYWLDGRDAIFADWVTGELHIPQGKVLDYIHMGFDTVYEEEIIFSLEKGVVTKTEVIPSSHRIRGRDLIEQDHDQ